MASISSLGTGSGIDLEGLLSQLLVAESQPVEQRLAVREAGVQSSISAFGTFKSVLSEFRTATDTLTAVNAFSGRLASSSDDTLFSAVADNSALPGSFSIHVLNLAQRHKLTTGDFSSPADVIGTGQLTISGGINSFTVDITAGSLTDIRDTINNDTDNFGVTANIITVDDGGGGTVSKLVFTAAESGVANELTITVDDDDLTDQNNSGLSQLFFESGNINNQLTEIDAAIDARITVDGFTVSSATNNFEGAIEGVTITALKASADPINDPPETLTISRDSASIKNSVTSFVESYNSLIETLGDLSSADPELGIAGPLAGDFTLRTLQSQLRRILSSEVAGLSENANSLVALGVTTNESGQLEIDEDKLNSAVENNLDDVETLFQHTSGIASQVDNLLDGYLNAGGVIQAREEGLNNSLEDIDDQREALSLRLENLENRFRQQFSALDALISQLNSTSSFLTTQLATTAAIINNRNDNNDN